MPSARVPATLQIGPGRLPASVASVAMIPSGQNKDFNSTPEVSYVIASGDTTLNRMGALMYVGVDNTIAATITLPGDASQGDVVTLVGLGPGLARIQIAASGYFNGSLNVESFVGPFASRSFVYHGAIGWTSEVSSLATQAVSADTTLTRAGDTHLVLVNVAGGNRTVTLPANAQVGDRITFVKSVAVTGNRLILAAGVSATIDGRTSVSLLADATSIVLVRVASGAWVTLTESRSVITVTATINLSTVAINEARDVYLLVRTSASTWSASSRQVTLPATSPVGATVQIVDVDGAAATNPILIDSMLGSTALGSGSPTTTERHTINTAYGAASALRGPSTWVLTSLSSGLTSSFMHLARVDGRVDTPLATLRATPMFNWNSRRVAVHAEFTSMVTNFFPVEGFSAGGSMRLEAGPGFGSQVGVLRCIVPAASSGYLHFGSLPSTGIINPFDIFGFRAVLKCITANPGTDYVVEVGCGLNISQAELGAEALFLRIGGSGAVIGVRRHGSVSETTGTAGTVLVSNRVMLECYGLSTGTYDVHFNGARTVGAGTNLPSGVGSIAFGMRVAVTGGAEVAVDVDSLTLFSNEMTRYQ